MKTNTNNRSINNVPTESVKALHSNVVSITMHGDKGWRALTPDFSVQHNKPYRVLFFQDRSTPTIVLGVIERDTCKVVGTFAYDGIGLHLHKVPNKRLHAQLIATVDAVETHSPNSRFMRKLGKRNLEAARVLRRFLATRA